MQNKKNDEYNKFSDKYNGNNKIGSSNGLKISDSTFL